MVVHILVLEMSLSTKRRARTLIINFMNDLFDNNIAPIYEGNVAINIVDLISKKDLLEKKYSKFEQLSEEIGELIEKDDDYAKDVDFVQKNELEFSKKLTMLSHFIDKQKDEEKAGKDKGNAKSATHANSVPVKLPKFVIKGFKGEPTEWESFKQSFEEAIDKHPGLSSIEKMNYLISYLSDDALRCIKGLQLSNQNYETAKQMLEKRFGNKQLVISSHVKKLLDLEFIDSKDIKGLRTLYDKIETEIRSLDALGGGFHG